MAPSDNLPIDIQYHKLTDALIDRKKLQLRWQDALREIRTHLDIVLEKANNTEIQSHLEQGKYVDYYQCKMIMNILLQSSESKSKSFFGEYTSPILREWNTIITMYEKNNVYLGEASRTLIQNTSYEIPSLKKTIQQSQKQIDDNNRKIADCKKGIAETSRKLTTMYKQSNVEGQDIRKELENQVNELPQHFNAIIEKLESDEMKEACEFYSAFQEFLLSFRPEENKIASTETHKQPSKSRKKTKEGKSQIKKNVHTTNNFEDMEPALQSINELLAAPGGTKEDLVAEEEVIEADAQVDWDIPTVTESAEVAWDISTEVEIDLMDTSNWDITTTVSNEENSSKTSDHEKEFGQQEENLSQNKLVLLADNHFRNRITASLLELQGFFQQRGQELQSGGGVTYANQFAQAQAILQQQTSSTNHQYLQNVEEILELLTSSRLQQLLLIKQAGRYLDRLVSSFTQKKDHIEKLSLMVDDIEKKNSELVDLIGKTFPQVEELSRSTKELQKQVEKSLEDVFKGFEVNIIGDINKL